MLCAASEGGLGALFRLFSSSNRRHNDGARGSSDNGGFECCQAPGGVVEGEQLDIPPIACVRCGHVFPHSVGVEAMIQRHAKNCGADIGQRKSKNNRKTKAKRSTDRRREQKENNQNSSNTITTVNASNLSATPLVAKECARKGVTRADFSTEHEPQEQQEQHTGLGFQSGNIMGSIGHNRDMMREGLDPQQQQLHAQANAYFLAKRYRKLRKILYFSQKIINDFLVRLLGMIMLVQYMQY